MNSYSAGFGYTSLVFLLGCFPNLQNLGVNSDIPTELLNRKTFKNVGVYQKNLGSLVGHVLYAKKTNNQCPTVYDEADLGTRQLYKPQWKSEIDNEATLRYDSKIDAGIKVKTGYFGIAADLTAEYRAQLIITDTSSLLIKNDDIPFDELEKIAQTPLGPDDCERYYIRGATLTTVTYKKYKKIESNINASEVFKTDGKAYASMSNFSLDFILGINVLPIRKNIKEGGNIQQQQDPLAAQGSGPDPLEKIANTTVAFTARKD